MVDTGAGTDSGSIEPGVADKLAVSGGRGNDRLVPFLRPTAFLTPAERTALAQTNSSFNGGDGNDGIDARLSEIWFPLSLHGNEGGDTIVGGDGSDYINGGRGGNDQINGRDRNFDLALCGTGNDQLWIDPIDWTNTTCEAVNRG